MFIKHLVNASSLSKDNKLKQYLIEEYQKIVALNVTKYGLANGN